jgi:hypothetical protein
MRKLAAVLERYVRRFPDQWLATQPAWLEDANQPTPRPPAIVKLEQLKARFRRMLRIPQTKANSH